MLKYVHFINICIFVNGWEDSNIEKLTSTSGSHFTVYNLSATWTEAINTCEYFNQTLLKDMNKSTIDAIRHYSHDGIKSSFPFFWTGLHRVTNARNSSNNSYIWYDCSEYTGNFTTTVGVEACLYQSISSWDLTTIDCNTTLPFVCQQDRENCEWITYRNTKWNSNVTGPISITISVKISLDECSGRCLTEVDDLNECWALSYEIMLSTCILHMYDTFLPFMVDINSVYEIESIYRIKECFSLSFQVDQLAVMNTNPIASLDCWETTESALPLNIEKAENEVTTINEISDNEKTGDDNEAAHSNMDYNISPSKITFQTHAAVVNTSTDVAASRRPDSVMLINEFDNTRVVQSINTQLRETYSPKAASSFTLPDSQSTEIYEAYTHEISTVSNIQLKDSTDVLPSLSPSFTFNTIAGSNHKTTSLLLATFDHSEVTDSTTTYISPTNAEQRQTTAEPSLDSQVIAACVCTCGNDVSQALPSQLDIEERVKEMISSIKLNSNNLSSTQRRFISVEDDRPSAQSIGYVGVLVLCSIFGGIVALDFTNLVTDILHSWRTIYCRCRRISPRDKRINKSKRVFEKSFSQKDFHQRRIFITD